MNLTAAAPGILPSPLLNTGVVPLEQIPAVAVAVLERRTLPGPSATVFNSSI